MTLSEKLRAMEALWDDLSRIPANIPAPNWHADVLEERKRLADEGQLNWVDLDVALDELRKPER